MLPIDADIKGLDNVVLHLKTWPDQRVHLTVFALERLLLYCLFSNFFFFSEVLCANIGGR